MIEHNINNMNININKTSLTLIGALTSKPYAFKARSWELKNTETIDLFESLCSNIRIDTRGSEIMRVLPLNNESLNEEWISDKTRFAYDGLQRKRFINPMIRENNLFKQVSWKKLFETLNFEFSNRKFNNVVIKTGKFTDLESLTALTLLSKMNNKIILNPDDNLNNVDLQENYLSKNFLDDDKSKKVVIIVGSNIRWENPILNIKLRKLSKKKSILIGYIGPKSNTNINMVHLGNNLNTLFGIISGKHSFGQTIENFLKTTNTNKKIHNQFKNKIELIFGEQFLQLINKSKILQTLQTNTLFNLKFNINTIDSSVGNINSKELGLFSTKKNYKKTSNLYYLLDSETIKGTNESDFIIYQGTHNEKIRTKCDIILPTLNWTEKSSIYLNCFGIPQKTNIVKSGPINARLDWKIITMIHKLLEQTQKSLVNQNHTYVENINVLHQKLNELTPKLMESISNFNINRNQKLNFSSSKSLQIKTWNNYSNFKSFISNYYQTNSIDKNSKIMSECTNLLNQNINNFNK